MLHRFLLPFTAVLVISASSAAFAAESQSLEEVFSKTAVSSSAAYQQGVLEGLVFSNPWADYRITFPDSTYFNPDSLVEYMSGYTGLDYEFAASLYGDMVLYPSVNITFQDALIPLKDCAQNLIDLYREKSYSCDTKSSVWIGNHPFLYVHAFSPDSDIYVDNYLRLEGDKLIWLCVKCPENDEAAQTCVEEFLSSITSYDPLPLS